MTTLENLLCSLNNYHKRHGILILDNDSKPFWVKVKNCWFKVSTGVFYLMIFCSSVKRFSDNSALNRALNSLATIIVTEVIITEFVFWMKRGQVLEIIQWCKKVEGKKYDSLNKPTDWFFKKRVTVNFILRFITIYFYGVCLFGIFVAPIIQTYLFGDGYHLLYSFQFKNFSERDSLPIFLAELFIFSPGFWFLANVSYLSFTFFILISNYVIGQMELIEFYIEQLDLNNVKKLRAQLRDLTEMHLDVLRTIKKISNIYLMAFKSKEYSLYTYVSLMVFGKESLSFIIPPAIASLITVVALYCFACEKMMEAEENIASAYYNLDWYTAPIASKKLLLLAMQEPEKIRFGRVYNSDYASMERFLLLVRRAYDFSLALLKLSKQ